jgi:tetratricopeptide (TPR) repeat protein
VTAGLLAMVVLGLGLAVAQSPGTSHLEAALPSASRQQLDLARAKEASGDLRRAEAGYTLVLSRSPGFAPALLALGRVRAAQGDVAGAIKAYERLPSEADAVDALAHLVEERDPARAAKLYAKLVRLRPGSAAAFGPLARAHAAAEDPDAALDALETWLVLDDNAHDTAVFVEVAVALRAVGREDEAVRVLEQALERDPDGPAAAEVRGRLDRIAVERAARLLGMGGAEPLVPNLRREVDQAAREAARGDHEDARERLEAVVAQAPRSAEAWAALADVLLALNDVAEAERAYGWAVVLEPDQSEWHARLGLLLAERYGGRRNREAADALGRALALRPAWTELQLRLGLLLQDQGDWEGALASYRACLNQNPKGAQAAEARQRIADLTREAPEPPDVEVLIAPPAEVSEQALQGYRIARIYLDRGDTTRARVELLPVMKMAPRWPAAHDLKAAIALRDGDEAAAIAAWETSLSLDPNQPQVKLVLAELAQRSGDRVRAIRLFTEAAAEGAPRAHYRLAVVAFEDHDLFESRRQLDVFFAAVTGGLDYAPAQGLRRIVVRRIRLLQGGVGGGVVLLLGGLVGLLVFRRSGRPLADLVDAVPEARHDVARVLSAIRHEVLKHNTTLLADVADAIEHDDQHAVAFAADRLFGRRGERGEGVVARFEAYLGTLTRIGRQHRLRLDLKRRDPVLSPMWAAMQRLRGLERALRSPGRGASGAADALREVALELNETGYRALGHLVRAIGTLDLTEVRLRDVADRVAAEPAFAGLVLPELEIVFPEEPVRVRCFAGDLDDVAANLLRNALKAGATRVGLTVEEEEDLITGHEHVALRFLDDAPGELTDEMVRGRGIERGLGLVVDLVARHEGSVTVERDPAERSAGWAKAVVVRLARAENEGETV